MGRRSKNAALSAALLFSCLWAPSTPHHTINGPVASVETGKYGERRTTYYYTKFSQLPIEITNHSVKSPVQPPCRQLPPAEKNYAASFSKHLNVTFDIRLAHTGTCLIQILGNPGTVSTVLTSYDKIENCVQHGKILQILPILPHDTTDVEQAKKLLRLVVQLKTENAVYESCMDFMLMSWSKTMNQQNLNVLLKDRVRLIPDPNAESDHVFPILATIIGILILILLVLTGVAFVRMKRYNSKSALGISD